MSLQIQAKESFVVNGKTFNSLVEAEAYVALQSFEAQAKEFVLGKGYSETVQTEAGKTISNAHFNTAVKAVALYMADQAAA